MEKRWRKECELCDIYITIFRVTHRCGEPGKTGEEKGWKNERNGRGGARCEVRWDGVGVRFITIRYTLSENA